MTSLINLEIELQLYYWASARAHDWEIRNAIDRIDAIATISYQLLTLRSSD